jgi:TldD protein
MFSAAAGSIMLGSRQLSAAETRGTTPGHWLDGALAPEALKALATTALDAATAHGATYADVRVAYRQRYTIMTAAYERPGTPKLSASFEGGVRALAGGAFGFHFANLPTTDALQTAGHAAATLARGLSAMSGGATELASAPVVQGTWSTPYEIDPFDVPLDEQADLCVAFERALGRRIPGAGGSPILNWVRETRVCMTTAGTVTTQTFLRTQFSPASSLTGGLVNELSSPEVFGLFGMRHGGYETVIGAAHQDRLVTLTEETIPATMYPTRTLDIGRYPVVFDGAATASLFAQLYGPSFQLDRVLGFEANASGTSFLAPLERTLQAQRETPLVAPSITLTASRPTEWVSGAKWDDDGVEPRPITLLDKGRVVNCLSDRQTAPALRDLVATQSSAGYASSETADRPPTVGHAHFTVAPSTERTSLDDLLRGITHGVLILGPSYITSDQQLASGILLSRMAEIRNGKMTNYIEGSALQFRSLHMLKSAKALGDARTMGMSFDTLRKGQPSQAVWNTASAPAMLCPDGDFMSTQGERLP